jgi:hypothetical protein
MTPVSPVKEGQVVAFNYTPPSPGDIGSSPPSPAIPSGGPTTPMPSTLLPGQSAQSLPVGSYTPPTPTLPSFRKSRRPLLWIALTALLLLVLISSSLGAYFAFFSKGTTPSTSLSTSLIVGHAYFVSSGLLSSNPGSNQGITDQLQIKVEYFPPPQSGKGYYAWLLNDISLDSKAIPLGQLTLHNGTAVLSFGGDAGHSNLLATNSRLLITEEDSAAPPVSPSLDPATYRYYAEFSQKKPDP